MHSNNIPTIAFSFQQLHSKCIPTSHTLQGTKSTNSGSTIRAEVSWHKSGQVLRFSFQNSVVGPQHTFPLVDVLLESCAITIFPSTSKEICSSVSLHAVFAPYKARKAVALVVYALCWMCHMWIHCHERAGVDYY